MITSGERNRRARFERPTQSKDPDLGSPVTTWEEVGTYWVSKRDIPPTKSEMVKNGMLQARQQSVLRMQWRPDITPDMRVVLLGGVEEVMQIVGGPAEIGNRDALEMMLERYSTAAP